MKIQTAHFLQEHFEASFSDYLSGNTAEVIARLRACIAQIEIDKKMITANPPSPEALSRECAALRRALKQARAWGVNSEGFSAEQSRKLAEWIDAGMVGTPPPIPDYYPPSPILDNPPVEPPSGRL